jgi:hypothetical protein
MEIDVGKRYHWYKLLFGLPIVNYYSLYAANPSRQSKRGAKLPWCWGDSLNWLAVIDHRKE